MLEHIDRGPLRTGCAVPLAIFVAYAVAFVPVVTCVVIAVVAF